MNFFIPKATDVVDVTTRPFGEVTEKLTEDIPVHAVEQAIRTGYFTCLFVNGETRIVIMTKRLCAVTDDGLTQELEWQRKLP